jgi:hypothetical protein
MDQLGAEDGVEGVVQLAQGGVARFVQSLDEFAHRLFGLSYEGKATVFLNRQK